MTTMTELGALLRQERELRGLSHDEISRKIKVAIRTLVALENGEISELPHAVYTKGFVKSYARLVGLDPEEIGQTITEIYAEVLLEQDDPEPAFTSRRIQPPKPRWPWVVLVVAVCCLIVGGGWYLYFRTSSAPAIVSSMPQSSTGSAVAGASAPAGETAATAAPDKSSEVSSDKTEEVAGAQPGSDSVATQDVPAGNMAPSGVVASPDQPDPAVEAALEKEAEAESKAMKAARPVVAEVAPAKTVATPAKPAEVPAKPQSKPQAQPAAQNEAEREQTQKHSDFSTASVQAIPLAKVSGEQKLTLTATDECWVEAWGEKFERKELYLRSGQKFVLRFPNGLTLRLGNSGGVTISLNNKAVAIPGEEGKVMTLNFTPAH